MPTTLRTFKLPGRGQPFLAALCLWLTLAPAGPATAQDIQSTLTVLHTLNNNRVPPGSYPAGKLLQASDGKLYGVTYQSAVG